MKTLSLFLISLAFVLPAQALQLENVDYIVMKDKDGDEERLMGKSEGLYKDKMIDMVFDIPVTFSKKKFRCDSAKETPWRLERRVESQLEMQGLIDALIKMEKPRSLSEAQKKTLTRIPICEPWILQLKVISRLLSGYDLVRVQKLVAPDEDSKDE